jgi:hypothetical protein
MKKLATPSILLAGLIAFAGAASAQTGAAATSNVPTKAGEASTMTQGVPNAKTTNSTASEAPVVTKDQAREDAQGRGKATATTTTPGRAGEASTMVNGKPNANPDAPTLTKSKSERKMEKELKKADRDQAKQAAIMGQKGAQAGAEAGTPPNSPAGNPSVFKGGTPQ